MVMLAQMSRQRKVLNHNLINGIFRCKHCAVSPCPMGPLAHPPASGVCPPTSYNIFPLKNYQRFSQKMLTHQVWIGKGTRRDQFSYGNRKNIYLRNVCLILT